MKAKIHALTHDGRGIAKVNHKTTFIENALPGEEVVFSYTKKRGKFDEGKADQVLTASQDRTEPLCLHFNTCGGCAMQHMNSQAQLNLKQKVLLDNLKHFGGITPAEILTPVTGENWGYRRKARFAVEYNHKTRKLLVGFHEKSGHTIADIDNCKIIQPPLDNLILSLKKLIRDLDNYQKISQIEVSITDNQTALVFRHLTPLSENDLQKLMKFGETHQLTILLQPNGSESIHTLWPIQAATTLSYSLPAYDLELEFGASDFIQVNSNMNQKMIALALELLDLKTSDNVLDLFCGIGNFTLPIARYCQQVIGIEGSQDLVAHAKNNAKKNKIVNVKFFTADLNQKIDHLNLHGINKILLDPPRTGAFAVIEQLASLGAEKIVYISCNPATLARDAGELVKQGYQLIQTGIIDMFPHTAHVEAIALFQR